MSVVAANRDIMHNSYIHKTWHLQNNLIQSSRELSDPLIIKDRKLEDQKWATFIKQKLNTWTARCGTLRCAATVRTDQIYSYI